MCIGGGTPDIPAVPERQPTKLPDQGSSAFSNKDVRRKRLAMMAGLITSPQGALGAVNTSSSSTSSTLG